MNYSLCLLILIIIVEALAMSIIEYSANNKNNYYIIGLGLYMLVGYILYKILINSDLAITNAKWNVVSIVLVTSIGIFYFKEKLTTTQKVGMSFAIMSIILMEYEQIKKIFN